MAKKPATIPNTDLGTASGADTPIGITLADIVSATQSETGFLFAEPAMVQNFVDNGLAEVNTGLVNPSHGGEFAVRATPKGIEAMNTTADSNVPQVTAAPRATFLRQIVEEAKPPRASSGGGTLYPWDELVAPTTNEAGKRMLDAFFIPATADKPNPVESIQSAISSTNRNYGTKIGVKTVAKKGGGTQERAEYSYTRKFRAVAGEARMQNADGTPGEVVKGAWVQRIQ